MWIFTETGFVSAVAHGTRPNDLVVRARDRQSLEQLATLAEASVLVGIGTDYRYRIVCPVDVFKNWMEKNIRHIKYRNFKDRVHVTRGDDFADALMDVWFAMTSVTDVRYDSNFGETNHGSL